MREELSQSTPLQRSLAWALRAALIGAITGPLIALLALLINKATAIRVANPWLIFTIPLGGVLTTHLFLTLGPHLQEGTIRIMSVINRSGKEREAEPAYTEYVADPERRVSTKLAPLLYLTSFITHLVGASGGKEGVGVQIGSSLGSYIGEAESRIRGRSFSVEHQGIYLIAGAASGFAALFNAPVAGVLFGLQFSNPRMTRTDAFLPALIAAYVATLTSQLLHIHTIETIASAPFIFSFVNLGYLVAAAAAFGLLSRLFCSLIYHVRSFARTRFANPYLRSLITTTVLLGSSLFIYALTGSFAYNGLSTDLIARAGLGETSAWAPLFKLILTLLTIASGFIGGEVVPILVIGSTSGALFASLFGLPASTFAMFGAVGMLSGATKLPLACFALGLELFGYGDPVSLFFLCACSYFISGPASIYAKKTR